MHDPITAIAGTGMDFQVIDEHLLTMRVANRSRKAQATTAHVPSEQKTRFPR
jgi:hypothetical protein